MRQYPFIISASLIEQLIAEGLTQYSSGDPKVKFPVPLHFFDKLDVFYTFRLQDLMGLSATGGGEQGRYYYIEHLDYDFMGDQIMVTAIDLQYVLSRYFVLGDETALASNWSSAGPADRMFGYLCDEAQGPEPAGSGGQYTGTPQFADGEPGKALINEGLVEDY